MKHGLKVFALLLALLLLCGCSKPAGNQTRNTTAEPQTSRTPEPASATGVSPATETPAPGETETSVPSALDTTETTEAPVPAEIEWEPLPELRTAADYADLYAVLSNYDFDRRDAAQTEACGDDEPWFEPIGDGGVEQTSLNAAEPGVVLGAKAVLSDGVIYQIDDFGFWLLSAAGKESEILSFTAIEGPDDGGRDWLQEIYVRENRAAVIYVHMGTGASGVYDATQTHVCVYDVSNPRQPSRIADFGMEGSYQTSRMIGENLYLLASRYLWGFGDGRNPEELLPQIWQHGDVSRPAPEQIWLSPNPTNAAITTLASVSVTDGALKDLLCSTDTGFSLCASSDSLYLARPVWSCGASAPRTEGVYQASDWEDRMQTELRKLRLGADGSMEQAAHCLIDGAVLDLESMDLREGVLRLCCAMPTFRSRIYTDASKGFRNCEPGGRSVTNRVVTLDTDLRELGSLPGVGGDRDLSRCRFSGSFGWCFPAENQDEVFWLDLSDPQQPKAGGSTELHAVTRRLQPLTDDSLLSFVNAEAGEGVELSLLDLRDPSAVQIAAQAHQDLDSSVTWETSGLYLDAAGGRFGFPVQNGDEAAFVLYTLADRSIEAVGSIRIEYSPYETQFLSADGLLYLCSPGQSSVIDLETLELVAILSEAVG